MPTANASTLTSLIANLLDTLADTRSAEDALLEVDLRRRQIAGESVFSIQQNVTTGRDPADEIRLRRLYSSVADDYPVNGAKRKTLTPWTECLFLQGRVFVAEGSGALARHFDDFDQMRPYGLQSVINVPLLQGNLCYATFNVFGTRPRWRQHEVLGIRLLALAAARWVPAAPGLAYRFTGVPLTHSMEA
ncbi:GAF domain-containing protein [Variovorax humicola]|uniref:GAF domain-containing protein n=1 Tax=Variovorax humicola TaxID=1769758 RepID=A0ABU8W8W5_9BURK